MFINRAYLIEEDDGINCETAFFGFDERFCGIETILIELRRDRGDNRNGAVAVGNIVLQDESRARLFNLGANRGIKINEIHLTTTRLRYRWFPCHASSSRAKYSSAICRSRVAHRSAPSL